LVDAFHHQLTASRLVPGESCLCITDSAWHPACARACVTAARALGAEVTQIVLPAGHQLPPDPIAASWRDADLIVYATSHRLHYRPEIRAALDGGARVLAAMQPAHLLMRLNFDADVRRRTRAGAARLDLARHITIRSRAGTDLRMDKSGRRGLAHYGAADEPGRLDFWTAGMVQAAQLEGTLAGTLVLDRGDCCFHLERMIDQPVVIAFEHGRAVTIEGGRDARAIRQVLEAAGDPGAWMAGHMAWGADRRARWLPPVSDDPEAGSGADIEAHYGNVQIEIGSNDDVAFRGRNRSAAHLGMCLRHASLWLDDAPILDEGRFVPEPLT
jgi:2,5-dihydroxypyridine 5,6-dioxygenase